MTKTLKLRIKDKHARVLSAMAREVNTVWNFCNETSHRSIGKAAVLLLSSWLALPVWAQCRLPSETLVQVAPSALHPSDRLLRKCFEDYSVVWSPVTLAPVVTLELLEPERIRQARKLPRTHDFHEMPAPKGVRVAWLSDFKRSGYDRGHMAPNGDMSTSQAQWESFSLINVVAQNSVLNRGSWAAIESLLREYVVVNDTPVWVLTGPGWERPPASLPRLKGDKSPAIPNAVWKLVHIPKYQLTGAVWATNPPPGKDSPKAVYEFLSLDEFGQRTGLVPSLGMSAPQMGEQARRTPVESWMPQLFRGLPLRQVARP